MNVQEAVDFWYGLGHTPIPIHYASKRPKIKWSGIDGVQIARPMVNAWFRNWGNVGVLLKRGLTVIDFDSEEAWERWDKVETMTVKTSRGYHAYFQVRQPLPKSLPFDGGDIKASGYVLVPPSLHPSGVQYELVKDVGIREIFSVNELGLKILTVSKPERGGVLKKQSSGREGLVDKIKDTVGIMEVLRSVKVISEFNGKLMAVCPFHSDTKASLEVNLMTDRCYCYATGCKANHKGFDVIDAYAALKGISNRDAILALGSVYGLL